VLEEEEEVALPENKKLTIYGGTPSQLPRPSGNKSSGR